MLQITVIVEIVVEIKMWELNKINSKEWHPCQISAKLTL